MQYDELRSPLTEIMTKHDVASWLKVKHTYSTDSGFPYLDLGDKTKRYVVKDVAAWLEAQRRGRRKDKRS